MTFAKKLKSERKRLGLTQAELAAELDVSPSWVEKVERGVRDNVHVLMQEGGLARLEKLRRKRAREG